MIPDEAKQLILDALADRPSGPPGEEMLAVLLAAAWDEGADWMSAGCWTETGSPGNPYRANE